MENGEWVHYPAKPGHYGCWEYVIGDKHHLYIVNYDEMYQVETYESNTGRYLGGLVYRLVVFILSYIKMVI